MRGSAIIWLQRVLGFGRSAGPSWAELEASVRMHRDIDQKRLANYISVTRQLTAIRTVAEIRGRALEGSRANAAELEERLEASQAATLATLRALAESRSAAARLELELDKRPAAALGLAARGRTGKTAVGRGKARKR
jgi:hypothetical protein